MDNELQRLADVLMGSSMLTEHGDDDVSGDDLLAIVNILTALAQATKDEPETAIVNDGYDDLVTKENRDYWKCKAERYMVLTESQVRINALLNEENDQLKQQLAIYKGRDEGKQLVINQLEAEIERLRKDAAIGEIVWRFIDRMKDIDPTCDPADKILNEFVKAVMPAIDAALSRSPRSASGEPT